MAEKRKTDSGLVLLAGESQRSDGRYRYRYVDADGKPHDCYSWRLRPQDEMPAGRKWDLSLREKEAQIQKALIDGLAIWDANMTLERLAKQYIDSMVSAWSRSTVGARMAGFRRLQKAAIGRKRVGQLVNDDFVLFYRSLFDAGLSTSSVNAINSLVLPALDVAVRRRLVALNPARQALSIAKKQAKPKRPAQRQALEDAQLSALLSFVEKNDGSGAFFRFLSVLAWTGCRFGELAALTWDCVDFKSKTISIRRNLTYEKGADERCSFELGSLKTENGRRTIPMLANVEQILQSMRPKVTRFPTAEITAADTEQFVFHNSAGGLLTVATVDKFLRRTVKKYNALFPDNELPTVSCHTFRHTFCSWACENVSTGAYTSDLKLLQQLLGHSDVALTLNVYAANRRDNMEKQFDMLRKISMGL